MRRYCIIIMLCLAAATGTQAQHIGFKWHGLYGVAGYDYMANINRDLYSATFSSVELSVGWMIRNESAVGIGFSYLSDANSAFSQMPVFIEYRSHFSVKRVSPFTTLQLGYSLPVGTSNGGSDAITLRQGGVSFSAIAGIRFGITHYIGLNLHFGYQMLMMNEVEQLHDNVLAETQGVLFHNYKVGVGINF